MLNLFKTYRMWISQEHIRNSRYVNGLDYSKPLHENWQATTGYLEQYGIPRKYTAAINSTVMHKNSLAHLDETYHLWIKG